MKSRASGMIYHAEVTPDQISVPDNLSDEPEVTNQIRAERTRWVSLTLLQDYPLSRFTVARLLLLGAKPSPQRGAEVFVHRLAAQERSMALIPTPNSCIWHLAEPPEDFFVFALNEPS